MVSEETIKQAICQKEGAEITGDIQHTSHCDKSERWEAHQQANKIKEERQQRSRFTKQMKMIKKLATKSCEELPLNKELK